MLSPVYIAESLSSDRTKHAVARLASKILSDGLDIEAYVEEVRKRPLPVKWYMTWMLSHYVEEAGELGPRDQRLIWRLLTDCGNHSMERDLWRALSFIGIDEDIAGDVFDAAMQVVTSPQTPIAARAHAMYVARNIALPYDELRRELVLVLKGLGSQESAAIRTRKRNILGQIHELDASRGRL